MRVDSGSRIIKASAEDIYRALIHGSAVAQWRAPKGMRADIHFFDARVGGGYRMALFYDDEGAVGKTARNEDEVSGTFVELVPNERVVERVTFASDNPAFAGAMTITTTIAPVADGMEVTIAASDVPSGISAEDHRQGIASTLENLAAFVE